MSEAANRPPVAKPEFSHRASLYASTDDLLTAAVPFIREGLDEGDVVVTAMTPSTQVAIDLASGPLGPCVPLGNPRDHHPHAMFARCGDLLAGLSLIHEERVRVIREQTPAGRSPGHTRELLCCEAAANIAYELSRAKVLCLYDLRTTPTAVVDDVYRTHPEVLSGGATPHVERFVDPVTYVRRQQMAANFAPPPQLVAALPFPNSAREARVFLARQAATAGLDVGTGESLVTAVNEIVSNALNYAILLQLKTWTKDGVFVCEVADFGLGLDHPLPGYLTPPPEASFGRGLWMARRLCDLMEIQTSPGGTTIRLHAELHVKTTDTSQAVHRTP